MNIIQIIGLIITAIVIIGGAYGLIGYTIESTPDPNGWVKPKPYHILIVIACSILFGVLL